MASRPGPSRATLYALAGAAVVAVPVLVLVFGMIPLRDHVRARLVAAGFADGVEVTLAGSDGVLISGLTRSQPVRLGPLAVELHVDTVRVPLDLAAWLRRGTAAISRLEIRDARVTVLRAPTESTPASVARRPVGGLGSALERVCPAGCVVTIDGLDVDVDVPGIDVPRLRHLAGEARVASAGDVALRLAAAGGPDLHARIEGGPGGRRVEAHLVDPPTVTVGARADGVEAPWWSALRRAGGAAFDEATLGARAIHLRRDPARHGAAIRAHAVGLDARLLHRGAVHARLRAELASAGGDAPFRCPAAWPCPARIEGLQVDVPGGWRTLGGLALEAERVDPCGPGCLQVAALRLDGDAGAVDLSARLAQLRLGWGSAGWLPTTVDASNGSVRLALTPIVDLAPPAGEAGPPDADEATDAAPPAALAALRAAFERGDVAVTAATDAARKGAAAWLRAGGAPLAGLAVDDVWIDWIVGRTPRAHAKLDAATLHAARDGAVTAAWRGALHGARSDEGGPPAGRDEPPADRGWAAWTTKDPIRVDAVARASGDGTQLAASLALSAAALGHPMIAEHPLHVPPFRVDLHGGVSPHGDERGVWLHADVVAEVARDTPVKAAVSLVATLAGADAAEQGALGLHLAVPRQDCAALFGAIPHGLVPRLAAARFAGEAALRLDASLSLASLRSLRLDIAPDLERCAPTTLGPQIRLSSLLDDLAVFRIEDPTLPDPVAVGPGPGDWVPLEVLPAHVWGAALATEDMRFFHHQGFADGLLRRAVVMNLERGRYAYGGSTITQQLVKNLFFHRRKTLARKLSEAVVVWAAERTVPKERLLELYLNCVEFGPEIYGVRAAARAYFGVEPEDLRPVEAAFIMALKPAPARGYRAWEKRRLRPWWRKRIETIRRRLVEQQWLSPEAAEGMDPETLFDRAAPPPAQL